MIPDMILTHITEPADDLIYSYKFNEVNYFFKIHKEVTGMKFPLNDYAEKSFIRKMWKKLTLTQFEVYYDLLEHPDELLTDFLSDGAYDKLERLFKFEENNLSFFVKTNKLQKSINHIRFNALCNRWVPEEFSGDTRSGAVYDLSLIHI